MKAHKLLKNGATCRVECSCGYMAKRYSYVLKHVAKHDPSGWERHIADSEALIREHIGGAK